MIKKMIFLLTFLIIIGIKQELLSQNKNITINYKYNKDKSVDIFYKKKLPGSYYLNLKFPSLQNFYPSDFEGVIKNNSGHLLKLKPIHSKKSVNFSYKYSTIRGNPNPQIDKSFNYALPFNTGEKIKIFEITNLNEKYFNVEKDSNWKSFITDRINPDTIYSMRKGIVIEIVDTFETDSINTHKHTSNMNKIFIEHLDGSVSRYIGLDRNSIFVKPGQTVYPKTKLGTLGLFNNSTYRLYFDISYLKDVSFDLKKKRTFNSKSLRMHINPYFYSSNGSFTLINNNEYIVEFDDTIRFKEFTKREKKKFKKETEIFK